jgi:hypothetical protein
MRVQEAATMVTANRGTPLVINDLGGNEYLLEVGWSWAPHGDLVAFALAQHPATLGQMVSQTGQTFTLVTTDGDCTAVSVPVLLSQPLQKPAACLIWLDPDDDQSGAG